jgi:hypothetical protein
MIPESTKNNNRKENLPLVIQGLNDLIMGFKDKTLEEGEVMLQH